MLKRNVDTKLILEHAWQDESRIHFSFSVEVDDGCKIERTYVPDVVIPITEAVLKTNEFDHAASLVLPDNNLAILKGHEFYSKKENRGVIIDHGFYYVKEIIKEYPPVKMTVEDIEKKLGYKITLIGNPKDNFDFETGAKIAFDRLMDSEEKGYKRVRRPAKEGEWVQINAARGGYSKELYDSNGIYKVFRVKGSHTGSIYIISKLGNKCVFLLEEYDVLEGYEPEKEKTVIPHLECFGMNYGQMSSTTDK